MTGTAPRAPSAGSSRHRAVEPAGPPIGACRPALVLTAHGTENPAGPAVFEALAGLVRDRLPGVHVRVAYVDVIGPTLTDVLAQELEQWPSAVVAPAFLGSGYHVKTDIPGIVARHGQRVAVARSLGPDPEVIEAVADRLSTADTGDAPDAVVLAAAGSSRAQSRRQARRAADVLSSRLGLPVTVGFVTGPGGSVPEAVREARAVHGGVVAVAAYLLAPGVFHERLRTAGADLLAPPIGAHPALADLVTRRYHSAADRAATRLVMS